MVPGTAGRFFCQLNPTICPYRLDKLHTSSVVTAMCQLAAALQPSRLCFSSVYVCRALEDPWGEKKTMNILNISLYFRSTKDSNGKHILYRHSNRRNFQAADCSLPQEDFLPQITKVQAAPHTTVVILGALRYFLQHLCVPWIVRWHLC